MQPEKIFDAMGELLTFQGVGVIFLTPALIADLRCLFYRGRIPFSPASKLVTRRHICELSGSSVFTCIVLSQPLRPFFQ